MKLLSTAALTLLSRKEGDKQNAPRKNHGCLVAIIVALVVYVAICGIIGASMGSMFSTPETKLKDNTVYKLELNGTVIEQGKDDDSFTALFANMPGANMPKTIGLDDILSNIKLAQGSDKVKGIYLYDGQLGVGQAAAKEIREALLEFKASGKWIVAYSSVYTPTSYYIASVADELYMNPTGVLVWNGLSAQKMYYTRALEKLGVEMQVVKVGTFKAAVEPFFRTSMSDADRLQTQRYLDGVWGVLKQGVSESRGISVEDLDRYADRYMALVPQEEYVTTHMVDSLVYIDYMDTRLEQLMGTDEYHCLKHSKFTHVKRSESTAKDKIAILYAEGQIYDQGKEGIVEDQMLKQIKKIREDEHVKAVVMRVNSPGGSADASEQIHHAIQTLRDKGLPVVVSMGDLAASGGYYISCGADYIFAEPNTLTGSIGIFGTIPCWVKLREKVGLDIDHVSTNRHANMPNNMVFRGMDKEEEAIMQNMVNRGYDLFTRRCAEGRHMSQDSIKAIGEGRVWLGEDALQLGLVDELGGMDQAIRRAADMAQLNEYSFAYYPERKDPMDELLSLFDQSTEEERLLMRLKAFASEPRVMALVDVPTIK